LIVEDEQDIVKLIKYHLEKNGYNTMSTSNGEDALLLTKRERPDLIILDLMLPGIDGLEVCRELKADRELSETAIIMLTARGEERDITLGLEIGADDYVTKPFSPKELVARVNSVLRRTKVFTPKRDLKINLDHYETRIRGKVIPLTRTEFNLLYLLVSKPGRVFTRDQLLDAASGTEAVVIDRTIDVHIASLRKKLRYFKDRIITIRGVGYKFRDSEKSQNKQH